MENENQKKLIDEEYETNHSNLTRVSYGFYSFFQTFLGTVFGSWTFFFYETAVGLKTSLIITALVIYTIWDAINDPLLSYLTDRNTKLTKRWGRRFPWVIITMPFVCLILFLLFIPPDVANVDTNPWPVFFWLLFMTCALDTFLTIFIAHTTALFPEKFRSHEDRRKTKSIGTGIEMLALPVGMMVPPMLVQVNDISTYPLMMGVCALILFIAGLISLPSLKDDAHMIKTHLEHPHSDEMSFMEGIKEVFKHKNLLIYLVMSAGFAFMTNSLTGSVNYMVFFLLKGTEDTVIFMFSSFLAGSMISIPFWSLLCKKQKDLKKTLSIGGLILVIGSIPMMFISQILFAIVAMFILGFTMGNLWVLLPLNFYISMEEFTIRIKKNEKGIVIGVSTFLLRFINILQWIVIGVVHIATGFEEGYATYDDMAAVVPNMKPILFGIRLHSVIIPAIILAISTFIFWRKSGLTSERIDEIKVEIEKLGF